MSAPLPGHGTVIEILGPTGGTQLGSPLPITCMSIDASGVKQDSLDVTDMGTAGVDRAFIPGLRDNGDVTIKFNYKPTDAGQAGLMATVGIMTNFKIVAPSPSTWVRTFSAFLTGVDFSFPDDKPITGSAKLKISGAITDATM